MTWKAALLAGAVALLLVATTSAYATEDALRQEQVHAPGAGGSPVNYDTRAHVKHNLKAQLHASDSVVAASSSSGNFHEGTSTAQADLARAPNGDLAQQADNVGGAGPRVSLVLLLAMTMFMALLSGVGALPFLFTGKLNPYWAGIASAVGCGVMLAASFDLLEESKPYSATLVLGGIVLGVVAMALSQQWLDRFEDVSFSDLQGADARKAMLILGVMAAHAFGEGSGVGVSFSGPRGWAQGLLVTIAIGLHNIPEGMAVATVMVARGTPPCKALYWTLLSALPQGIVAVPAYMFVEAFQGLLPIALGFAAGCMIWIVFAELMPDALETAAHSHVATAATLSAASLQYISMMIAKLERPDGTVASPVQADLPALLRDLLLLSPGFLSPVAVAACVAAVLPSLPLTLGATAGAGAWMGLAGLGSVLLRHHLHKHTAVLLAAAGGVAATLAWRALASMGSPPRRKSEDSASDNAVEAPAAHRTKSGNAAALLQHEAADGWAVSGAVHATGIAVGNWQGLERRSGYSNAGTAAQQLPHHLEGIGSGSSSFVAVDLQQRLGLHAGANGHGQHQHHHLGSGKCNCRECDSPPNGLQEGQGHAPLHFKAASDGRAGAKGGPQGHWDPARALDLGFGSSAATTPHGSAARATSSVALLALLLHGVAQAYGLGEALLGNFGDSTRLLLPLILAGVPCGLASVGAVRALTHAPGWPAPVAGAAGLALATLLAVGGLLLPLPLGSVPAASIAFDPTHVGDMLAALAAGAALLVSVGYVWPLAAQAKVQRAQLGACLGFGAAAAAALLQAALCMGTPYCLAAAPPRLEQLRNV